MRPIEKDPYGLSPHQPGAKLDAGKVRPSLVLDDMARAIWAVAEVATYGAEKYSDGGWLLVKNALQRYADAKDRHRIQSANALRDPETGLLHAAHEAWNALALLELQLRGLEAATSDVCTNCQATIQFFDPDGRCPVCQKANANKAQEIVLPCTDCGMPAFTKHQGEQPICTSCQLAHSELESPPARGGS